MSHKHTHTHSLSDTHTHTNFRSANYPGGDALMQLHLMVFLSLSLSLSFSLFLSLPLSLTLSLSYMNESRHIHEWFIPRTRMSQVKSRHVHEWVSHVHERVMSRPWMGPIAYMKESRHAQRQCHGASYRIRPCSDMEWSHVNKWVTHVRSHVTWRVVSPYMTCMT